MSALATRVFTPTASLEKSTRKPTARVLSLALPAPARGRLRESNPHRTAAPPSRETAGRLRRRPRRRHIAMAL